MKNYKLILIIFVAIVCIAGVLYVTNVGLPFLNNLFGRTSGLDAAGGRVEGDIDAVSDSLEPSGESLERLDRGLGDIRESTEAIESGVERAEGRASELEARNLEIEKSLGGIRDASSRARAAIELGKDANRRLEALIRRLQEEGGEGSPPKEDLADNLVD